MVKRGGLLPSACGADSQSAEVCRGVQYLGAAHHTGLARHYLEAGGGQTVEERDSQDSGEVQT